MDIQGANDEAREIAKLIEEGDAKSPLIEDLKNKRVDLALVQILNAPVTLAAKRNMVRTILEQLKTEEYKNDNLFGKLLDFIGQPRQEELTLCQEHLEDPFSNVKIDTTLTEFTQKQIAALKAVYLEFAYKRRKVKHADNMKVKDGVYSLPLLALRKLDMRTSEEKRGDDKELEQKVETTMVGRCQLGKSIEAAWAAWCSYFILGCIPVVFIRNGCGPQGIEDMKKTVDNLNTEIHEFLVKYCKDKNLGSQHIRLEQFNLHVVLPKDQIQTEKDNVSGNYRMRKAQVLFRQNNSMQLKKFIKPWDRTEYLDAKIITVTSPITKEKGSGSFLVEFDDKSRREVKRSDLQRIGRRFLKEKGLVKVKGPKRVSSIITLVKKLFNEKDGLARLLFVIDEADLIINSAERARNKVQKLHYAGMQTSNDNNDIKHEMFQKVVDFMKVEIDAKVADLKVGAEGNEQVIQSKDLNPVESKIKERKYKNKEEFFSHMHQILEGYIESAANDVLEESALADVQAALDESDTYQAALDLNEQFEEIYDSELESFREVLSGAQNSIFRVINITATPLSIFLSAFALNKSLALSSYPQFKLVPEVVTVDVPGNYIAYDCPNAYGLQIERKELPASEGRPNAAETYKQAMIFCNLMTEEKWDALVTELDNSEKKGIDMCFSNEKLKGFRLSRKKSNDLSVSKPSNSVVSSDLDVLNMLNKYKEYREVFKKRASNQAWEQDGKNIITMTKHMTEDIKNADASSPSDSVDKYRHGLIITSRTGSSRAKQLGLAKKILEEHRHDVMAVATFDYTGVKIRFTRGALDQNCHEKVYDKAVELIREKFGNKYEKKIKWVKEGIEDIIFLKKALRIPVSYLYSALHGIVPVVIVITGRIGGRGVAYHDLQHKRILTDMYTAYDVWEDKEMRTHGEKIIQDLGRLNTLESFSSKSADEPADRKNMAPQVRLWAPKSCHERHQQYLQRIERITKELQTGKSYDRLEDVFELMVNNADFITPDVHLDIMKYLDRLDILKSKKIHTFANPQPANFDKYVLPSNSASSLRRKDFKREMKEDNWMYKLGSFEFKEDMYSLSDIIEYYNNTHGIEVKDTDIDLMKDFSKRLDRRNETLIYLKNILQTRSKQDEQKLFDLLREFLNVHSHKVGIVDPRGPNKFSHHLVANLMGGNIYIIRGSPQSESGTSKKRKARSEGKGREKKVRNV